MEAALASGDLRAVGFHDRVKVGILSVQRVRAIGEPDHLFFNVNTPADLAEAKPGGTKPHHLDNREEERGKDDPRCGACE